ncbi:MAG: hypothetical protein F6J93_11220 [Oscillatoria sp. SIO1A7]|nr:hypothetical protein [Oscillatoria sp. SIO1A7]
MERIKRAVVVLSAVVLMMLAMPGKAEATVTYAKCQDLLTKSSPGAVCSLGERPRLGDSVRVQYLGRPLPGSTVEIVVSDGVGGIKRYEVVGDGFQRLDPEISEKPYPWMSVYWTYGQGEMLGEPSILVTAIQESR